MPHPLSQPDTHPIHLKSFDPKTFYPALGPRSDSLSIYPSSSVSQVHPPRPSAAPSYELPIIDRRGILGLMHHAEIHSSVASASEIEYGYG